MSEELDDDERAWQASLAKPATRGELLDLLMDVRLSLLGHSVFELSLFENPEEEQRKLGAKAIEIDQRLGEMSKRLVRKWMEDE